MVQINHAKTAVKPVLVSLVLMFAAAPVYAVTWNFGVSNASSNSNNGNSYGNQRSYSEVESLFPATTQSLVISAWADAGVGLADAFVGNPGDGAAGGLGLCNREERNSLSQCQGSQANRQIDNNGENGFLLFSMSQGQYQFDEITIKPKGNRDRDVSFWVGNSGNLPSGLDLDGISVSELSALYGFTQVNTDNSSGSQEIAVDLTGLQGNTLIFGASVTSGSNDRFEITSLSATLVPIPAAAWLMGSALLMLVMRHRKT